MGGEGRTEKGKTLPMAGRRNRCGEEKRSTFSSVRKKGREHVKKARGEKKNITHGQSPITGTMFMAKGMGKQVVRMHEKKKEAPATPRAGKGTRHIDVFEHRHRGRELQGQPLGEREEEIMLEPKKSATPRSATGFSPGEARKKDANYLLLWRERLEGETPMRGKRGRILGKIGRIENNKEKMFLRGKKMFL